MDQQRLTELGTPLAEVEFVVVDLETTGGAPSADAITEIGAVRVRGGHVMGEFHTLVDPGRDVPPLIVALNGLTSAVLRDAPRIESVLPSFLEFATGAVLVAHNAPFDIGFLRAACEATGRAWARPAVVDTAKLAKHVISREEVRNHRLASLAALFGSGTVPDHRALHDARATVDVLHGLLGRLGNLGVTHLPDLLSYSSRVPHQVRRKRMLADHLPAGPGVYLFMGPSDEVLYVGTSGNLRARVRSYFTASETRRRMTEMVSVARRVDAISCATVIEAQVRELRLIAGRAPRYNRRSRAPHFAPWVKLTVEPFPRLSVVRKVRNDTDEGARYIGPFASAQAAQTAIEAAHEAFHLRQCSTRLPVIPPPGASACLLADLGSCGAPCVGAQSMTEYARVAGAAADAMAGATASLVETVLSARLRELAAQKRFERAAVVRDRWIAFAGGVARAARLGRLAACAEIVAARRTADGGWVCILIRHGRLAGSTWAPPGVDPMPAINAMIATGESVSAAPYPASAASHEETELLARWLEADGVRLVQISGEWSAPRGICPAPHPDMGAAKGLRCDPAPRERASPRRDPLSTQR